MIAWGRRIQLLAGLLLLISPFFSWARVEVLGVPIGVPGLFFSGGVLMAVALLGCAGLMAGARIPGFQLLGAAVSGAVLLRAAVQITERTEYVLGRMQLSLADINAILARLGLDPVELYQRQGSGSAYLAGGLAWGSGAVLLLALGAALEALGYRGRGLTSWSVLVGRPRCSGCGFAVEHRMRFCPGCGRSAAGESLCGGCGESVRPGYRFCPACGASRAP
ncbi:MAG: zinc ribbon domain-containing protein [Armatimonadetes bacterium]|nr:zinc ribbon domain-containing protein [Armatimonadota bacterium]